jgi:hypothetical protein
MRLSLIVIKREIGTATSAPRSGVSAVTPPAHMPLSSVQRALMCSLPLRRSPQGRGRRLSPGMGSQ